MSPRPLVIFKFYQRGDCLNTSESDVYRRQILTYKDGPRTERVSIDDALNQEIVAVFDYSRLN